MDRGSSLADRLDAKVDKKSDPGRSLVRGSTLLLIGRVLSKLGNFLAQVLIVRYLSKDDYGAFTYALSVVLVVQVAVGLGLHRTVSRFLVIYLERGDHRRVVGTLLLTVGAMLSLGVLIVASLIALQAYVGNWIKDPLATTLLYILIFLAPLEALDNLLAETFAAFARPSAIFFRGYVLAPGLGLLVVLILVASKSSVVFLALGYVLATVVGLVVYGAQLAVLLRNQGLLRREYFWNPEIPWREVFGFTFPLVSNDLVQLSLNTVNVALLERFRSTQEVATLQAIIPVARMNEVIMVSFATLYTPMIARMYAKRDSAGINVLYWQTAIWLAVFSLPVFLMTFSLAKPLTVMLFGERYASAAPILAMLSFGFYLRSALGFSALTLRVYGRVRMIVVTDVIIAIVGVGFSLLLIPRFGAMGAGCAMMLTVVTYAAIRQVALRLGTDVSPFEWHRYATIVIALGTAVALLLLVPGTGPFGFAAKAVLALAASLFLIRLNADILDLRETFPELLKLPGSSWLLRPRQSSR